MNSLYKVMAVMAGVVVLAAADTATQKKPATTTKSATSKKSAVARKAGTTKRRPTATATKAAPAKTWRVRQLQPTPQRYKEIQQALASKGYLSGEQTGTWNQESIDALRRFQEDQKLDATGKIDSLSLIALGLGPKHETASATTNRTADERR